MRMNACTAALRWLALGTLSLAGPAWAQNDQPPSTDLKPGDPAPALKIDKWVKGQPVEAFEKGKVYVVEFWATWCRAQLEEALDEYKAAKAGRKP